MTETTDKDEMMNYALSRAEVWGNNEWQEVLDGENSYLVANAVISHAEPRSGVPTKILEVGSGRGRAIFGLIEGLSTIWPSFSKNPTTIDGIDISPDLVKASREGIYNQAQNYMDQLSKGNKAGVESGLSRLATTCFREDNILAPSCFQSENHHYVFSTFNTIGSVREDEREDFVEAMVERTKHNGRVTNITWTGRARTTHFMRRYYRHVGFKEVEVEDDRAEVATQNAKFTFYRVDPMEIAEYYAKFGIEDMEIKTIEPHWVAVTGKVPGEE